MNSISELDIDRRCRSLSAGGAAIREKLAPRAQCVWAVLYSAPRLPASLPLPARAGGLHRPQT